MITEIVLLNFIFWEILCHTGYPTESLGFSQRKIDVDFPFCLLRGNVRGKKNPPSYGLLSKFTVCFLKINSVLRVSRNIGKISPEGVNFEVAASLAHPSPPHFDMPESLLVN